MEVLTYPHPILRYVTRGVTRVDAEFREFVGRMRDVLLEENGLGLAANQVGLPFRLFLVHNDKSKSPLCFINPTVVPFGDLVSAPESCLSLPGVTVDVPRRARCEFKAWALNGDVVDEIVTGEMSRVIQHEMDHLNGILISDRLSEHQKQYGPVSPELRSMEKAWERYPRPFAASGFKELLYRYTDTDRPVEDRRRDIGRRYDTDRRDGSNHFGEAT